MRIFFQRLFHGRFSGNVNDWNLELFVHVVVAFQGIVVDSFDSSLILDFELRSAVDQRCQARILAVTVKNGSAALAILKKAQLKKRDQLKHCLLTFINEHDQS